ncbi:CynX/NimT family MFS transporter [Ruicaihuangia caeni]|uniref:MFS transporter n=1 Tax=Ruicaihuangia caeni TaxID=3042517 RepID=A0AAW6TB06_9MICO|nr:MFS transporter [Klugiella sp. YN-L-19]MDI2099235.1 MFS transporter [Klugiella sp. YN-L-19]
MLERPDPRMASRETDGRLILGLIAAALVGLNLRPAITSVAALLDTIAEHQQLTTVEVVLLSSLPIASFGVTAPLVPVVMRRLGVETTLFAAMVVLSLSLWLRASVDVLLLPATFTGGVAIMFGSVLIPPFLRSIAASPFWIGVTTTMFGIGAATGAWIAIPVYKLAGNELTPALGMWSISALVAALGMLVVVVRERGRRTSLPLRAAPPVTDASRTWRLNISVVATFALMAMVYATVIAWLPVMLQSQGVDAADAGALLAWFNVAGFLPTMLLGTIAKRPRLLLGSAIAGGVLLAAAMAGFTLGQPSLAWLLVTVIGVAETGIFGISMYLLVRNERPGSSVLSATSQGVGYVLGASVSALAGALQSWSGDWNFSLWLLCAISLALAVCAGRAVRTSR